MLLSLTCSVDQHLPQLLLVTGMYEVEHAVSSQVKLQQSKNSHFTIYVYIEQPWLTLYGVFLTFLIKSLMCLLHNTGKQ